MLGPYVILVYLLLLFIRELVRVRDGVLCLSGRDLTPDGVCSLTYVYIDVIVFLMLFFVTLYSV